MLSKIKKKNHLFVSFSWSGFYCGSDPEPEPQPCTAVIFDIQNIQRVFASQFGGFLKQINPGDYILIKIMNTNTNIFILNIVQIKSNKIFNPFSNQYILTSLSIFLSCLFAFLLYFCQSTSRSLSLCVFFYIFLFLNRSVFLYIFSPSLFFLFVCLLYFCLCLSVFESVCFYVFLLLN